MSIAASPTVTVTFPITVLILEVTAETLAAKASESRSVPSTRTLPLIITVGSPSSVPIRDSTYSNSAVFLMLTFWSITALASNKSVRASKISSTSSSNSAVSPSISPTAVLIASICAVISTKAVASHP